MNKEISARKIMAIMFSITYCVIMVSCTIALIIKLLTVETYVALLGAFALVVREIVDNYFNRTDRVKQIEAQTGGEK